MKTWILWSENLDTIALYWRVYHTDLPCSKTQWVLWKKKGCVLSRFIAPFWCLARTKLCLIYRSNTERHLLTKKDAYISWLNFFLSSHVAISLPTGLRLIFSYSGFLTYWKCFTICDLQPFQNRGLGTSRRTWRNETIWLMKTYIYEWLKKRCLHE